jgi:hypothetical protein
MLKKTTHNPVYQIRELKDWKGIIIIVEYPTTNIEYINPKNGKIQSLNIDHITNFPVYLQVDNETNEILLESNEEFPY